MIVFFVCGDSPHLAFMAVSHVYKKNSTRLKPLPLLIKFHCTYTHTLYHNNGIVKNVTQHSASQRCNNIPLWSLCFFI